MNGRFPIAIHIMTLLSTADGELLSSEYIAGSVNVNPALIRKEISNLRNHGLISSKEGKTGGYALGKSAEQITLADIYHAVKPEAILGQAKNTPNPACPVGKQVNKYVDQLNNDVDRAMTDRLGAVTLADFSKQFE